MTGPLFIDVFVDANDNAPDGCVLRFKSEGVPRAVRQVELDGRRYDVVGWSSANGGSARAAQAVLVEDSTAGVAMLVWGDDWGIRLLPSDGAGETLGETHLLLDPAAVELVP